jgi:DNA (cytosine-5)-methyltransferase 3A|tara:strand:+ start:207 stop:1421 length:1215 start_codon:yes stop_codon:yes gene_type:complete
MREALGLRILSLFDGMSCTQIALKNLDIKVDKYYSSEIDKYAMIVTQKNFPDTVQLGDIKDIKGSDFPDIDLIVGGSPCQGFSFAGKQLAFDDPRSALFFEFVRVLKEVKPKYFLLENVRMKQEFQDVISEQISSIYPECFNGGLFGIEPILINSAKLSAQNRNRLYWTNIPDVTQPDDRGILLKDILDYGDQTELSEKEMALMLRSESTKKHLPRLQARARYEDQKSHTLTASSAKGVPHRVIGWVDRENRPCELRDFNPDSMLHHAANATDIKGNESIKRVYADTGKCPTLTTMGGGHREPKVAVKGGAIRGRYNEEGKTDQHLEVRKDAKSNAVTTVQKDSIAVKEEELTWRKLTPLECERLQTVSDNYTEGVSNTQRYKMLGNGMTVKVIEHILKNMEKH